MTRYNTGIICRCYGCGQRWPLLTDKACPDVDSFWPIVFSRLDEIACPQCGGRQLAATLHFVEPKAAGKAEAPS